MKVVRAFAREEHEISKFEPVNEDLTNSGIGVVRMFAVRQPLFEAIAAMGVAAAGAGTIAVSPTPTSRPAHSPRTRAIQYWFLQRPQGAGRPPQL